MKRKEKAGTATLGPRLLIATILAGGLYGPSMAQTPPAAAEPAKDSSLGTIVVTGSNIRTTPDEVVVPVSVLGADQLEQAGVTTNLLEVLRKSLPTFAGRGNTGNSNANNNNQNTAGGSQLQLRNLDTLVLVNGRRVAANGINAIGGKNFVDANEIPSSAIDRIEVLTDGSSAIYGSDAIGGVVNIILKSGGDGFETGGRFAGAEGGYTESSAFLNGGGNVDGFRINGTVSHAHTDPLFQNQRPFSSPSPLAGRTSSVPQTVGTAVLAPGLLSPRLTNPTGTAATAGSLGALETNGTYVPASSAAIKAGYDLSSFQQLLLRQEQTSLVGTLEKDLLPDQGVTFFSDALYSVTRSSTQFTPIDTAVTVPANSPYNPLTTPFAGVQFGNTSLQHEFIDEAHAIRVTAGLRGLLGAEWNWETGAVFSQNLLVQHQTNLIYKPNLARAIAGGYDASGTAVAGGAYSLLAPSYNENLPFVLQPAVDPFARAGGVIPGSLTNLYGTETIHAASRLASWDAKVAGSLFSLPAGKVGVAAGIALRIEGESAYTDPNGDNTGPTAQRWIGGTYADPFSARRKINAAFAEVRAPITSPAMAIPGLHALDLIGAVRVEHYSDIGGSTVPKVGLRWQPMGAGVTVRGTYAQGFTAPTLYNLTGPTDTRIVGTGVVQTVFGVSGDAINGEDGNNPKLQPSKTDSYSLGFTLHPEFVPGLTMNVDYSDIHQKGFPGGIGFTNILQSIDQLGAASPFFNNLAVGNFPGTAGATQPFSTPGSLGAYIRGGGNSLNIYTIDQFRNLGGVKEKSINVSLEYEKQTKSAGTFTLSTAGAIFLHYQFQALPGQQFYEYAGTVTNGGTGVQGTVPRLHFYTSLDWKLGENELTVGNTYISKVTDEGAGGIVYATSTTLKPIGVPAYLTWDLRAAHNVDSPLHTPLGELKGWSVALGVNNIANRMPPIAPQAYTDNNADVSTYSPIGRLYYFTGSVQF